MKNPITLCVAASALLALPATSSAAIISVAGVVGNAAQIFPVAGDSVGNNDFQANRMQGFDEEQGVNTALNNIEYDGGLFLPQNTVVDSHLIFLNKNPNTSGAVERSAIWAFSGPILGVMSNSNGSLESDSNSLLGLTGITYPGTFTARGFEAADSYVVAGNSITVNMRVTEPGDWIRVVTASNVPSGGNTLAMFGAALLGLGAVAKKKRRA